MGNGAKGAHMARGVRTAASFVWAAVPLVSLGLATPLVFLYPAIRRRTAADWIAPAVYIALAVVFVATLDAPGGSAAETLGGIAFVLSWLGGTAHALIVRPRVFAPGTDSADAIATAIQRKGLREAARQAAQDPAIASELRIGRPDLRRRFDDGGLIDLNHAPPAVLASIPGMTPELVERIVTARAQRGDFASIEELSARVPLPPGLTGPLGEYAVFL
jgi:hypothetical protein